MEDKSNLEDWIAHHEVASSLAQPPAPICDNGTLQLANDCKPPSSMAKSNSPDVTTTDLSVGPTALKPRLGPTGGIILGLTNIESTTVGPPSPRVSEYAPLDHLNLAGPVSSGPARRSGSETSAYAAPPIEHSNQQEAQKLGDWIGEHKVLTGVALLALGFCTSERFRKAALNLFEEDGILARATEGTRQHFGPVSKDTEFLLNDATRTEFRGANRYVDLPFMVIPGVDTPRSTTRFATGLTAPVLDSAASYSHNAHTSMIDALGTIRAPGAEHEGAFHASRGLPRYRPGFTTFQHSAGIRHAHSLHNGVGNPFTMKW